jgi:quercetin dioxygenase-like cupin family protein
MTVARIELKGGSSVAAHSHHNEQVCMVLSGKVKFIVDGVDVIVSAGQILELKPNVPHGVEVLEDATVIDLFTPPRTDWINGDDAYLRG